MKKLLFLVLCFLLIHPSIASADTEVAGPISGVIVWAKEHSPYLLSGRVTVGRGSSLSIDPGVQLVFADNAKLEVLQGTLSIVGTETDPVVFTGSATSSSWTLDVVGSSHASTSMTATHVRMENAYQALYLQSAVAALDSVSIVGGEEGIYVSAGTLTLSNSTISNTRGNPLSVDSASTLIVASTSITDIPQREGITAYGNSRLDLRGVRIERLGRGSAIGVYSSSVVIKDSTLRDGGSSGIEVYGNASRGESQVSITRSTLAGFKGAVVYNGGGVTVSAEKNWWGSKAGPGGRTYGDVSAAPWLLRPPGVFGDSSILFVPGIQASRLSKGDNQLWEPNRNADVEALYLDSAGAPLTSDVRVGTIIDSVNSIGAGPNIYKTFMQMLDSLVVQKKISEWWPEPYDWRMAASAAATDNLVERFMQMASTSFTGKVSIVAHSNGGLVTRHLLERLAERHLDIVDKVIFVATPQLGTTQAIAAVLHGDGLQFAAGLLMKQSVGRRLAQYSPGALGLLPTQKYFDALPSDKRSVIRFSTTTDRISMNFFQSYGDHLDSASRLSDFLSATLDRRTPPFISDTDTPTVIDRTLLSSSTPVFIGMYPAADISVIAGWGLETLSGIEYSAKQSCSPPVIPAISRSIFSLCQLRTTLQHRPVWTRYGDKTVVVKSAIGIAEPSLTSSVQTFFVDLASYNNTRFRVSRNHADMLEVASVQTLLNDLLHSPEQSDAAGDALSSLPEHVSTSSPSILTAATPVSPKRIRLTAHSPVTLDLYDQAGNHTGLLENAFASTSVSSPFLEYEEMVPGSQYTHFGEAKYLSFDMPVASTTWTIALRSVGAGLLTLDVEYLAGDTLLQQTSFSDIPITPFSRISAEVALPLDRFETLANAFVLQTSSATSSTAITTLQHLIPDQGFNPIEYLSSVRQVIREICMSQRLRLELLAKLSHYISLLENGELPIVQALLKEMVIVSDTSDSSDSADASDQARFMLSTPEKRGAYISAVEAMLARIGTLSGGR